MSTAPKEVELTFLAPADCLDQLRSNPEFEAKLRAPLVDQTLVSTYYDFDNLSLRRHGLSLRVRQVGPHRMQTLKSVAGEGAPLTERTEFENEISGDLPDLGTLDGSPLSPILAEQGHNPLRPMFETRIHRKSFRIEQDGAEIEFAIDTGEIFAAGSAAPVSEIELELKRGDPGQLFALAKTINAIVPVELTLQRKSDTGYRLSEKQATAASLAPPIALDPAMATDEAFRHIARSCLRHMIANHGLVVSHDAKAVHQTRVALRRFRVAISAFSHVVVDAEVDGIKTGLQHFAQALGPARDLDVLIDGALKPFRARHPTDKGAASLIRSFNRQRAKAYEGAARAIDSREFREFVIACAAWIESGPWTTDAEASRMLLRQQPIAMHAAQQIARRRKQCRRIGRDLDALTDAERHRVRIGVKKLRYTVEFFDSLYPSRAAHKRKTVVLRACQKLQDALGALNDLAIRRDLFAKLLSAKTPGATDRAFAAGLLLGAQEHETPMLKKKAAKAWKAILAAKPFWKLSATPPPTQESNAPLPPLSGVAA